MTDLTTAQGALSIESPTLTQPEYDPTAAKGYLTDLKTQGDTTQKSYDDTMAARKNRLADMQRIIEQATQSLAKAREGGVNLPLLAAGSAMMMPSSTGSLGASLGAAGAAAGPAIAREREGTDANIMRVANLKSLPITMGDTIDRDASGQLSSRLNANQTQQGTVVKGMLAAEASTARAKQQAEIAQARMKQAAELAGVRLSDKDLNDMRRQAGNEARNQMNASLKSGAIYEGDEATIEKQMTDALYAQMFLSKYGKYPGQMTSGTAETGNVPQMPKRIEKESKDDLAKIGEIRTAGNTANDNFNQLNAVKWDDTTQGVLAPLVQGLGTWASSFGVPGEDVKKLIAAGADVTEFKKIAAQMQRSIENKAKGTQTEGDAKRVLEGMQNVTNSKEANALIRNFLQSQNLSAMYQQDIANDYVAGQKNRATGVDKHVNENARMPLTHTVDGKVVSLYEAYQRMRAVNPKMDANEAMKETVKTWKLATGG